MAVLPLTRSINIGILFGFLVGGWLNEFFNWRVAFVVVGLPGVLIAVLIRFTLHEPIRGLSEQRTASSTAAPFGDVLRLLWQRRSFRHMAMGSAMNAFAVYSMNSWTASFMMRSFGLGSGEVGTWLALILGAGGAVGLLGGGLLAERLALRDTRWYMWIPALAALVSLPFTVLTYMASDPYTALALFIVPGFLATVYLGNTLAMVHGLVGLRMRALASAILFFILNLIGLGLGPFSIGALSDYLQPVGGVQSLRLAMLYLVPIAVAWSAAHFVLASRTLREDLAAAPD